MKSFHIRHVTCSPCCPLRDPVQWSRSTGQITNAKKQRQLEGLSRAHTSPTDLDLPKFNHLVACGQGYDWPCLVTIKTWVGTRKLFTDIYVYRRRRKHNLPSHSVGEVMIVKMLEWHNKGSREKKDKVDFLPHNAMLALYMICCHHVLSSHLSVTSQCSTKIAKPRIMKTTPHDSPDSIVFWCQKPRRNSKGIIPNEGAKKKVG